MKDGPAPDSEISHLYFALLDRWNKRDARGYSELLHNEAIVIGFDGSQMLGREAVRSELNRIFQSHKTGEYVAAIRDVRPLGENAVLLSAAAGMIKPGTNDLNPDVNAIQSLVAVRETDRWQVALFQNTPAQFHGRLDLAEALTSELRALIPSS